MFLPCKLSLTLLSPAIAIALAYSMSQVPQQITAALAVVLIAVVSRMEPSACSVVKASVSCVDCGHDYDLSGIRVMIECDEEKKLGIATTNQNGSFEADLPLAGKGILVPASNCLARLLGGPGPLYALNENMVSKIIMAQDIIDTYTTSTPLSFIKSCCPVGKNGKYKSSDAELDSKTVDLPIPSEFGLPPTSYYTPIIPIIGIP
ncbi:hypothetical protein Dimus_020006 [Dionaea muscipula]